MRNLYFILLLFLSACQLGVPKFPKEETLSAELMPLEGTTFPLRLEIKHPYLVLQNLKLQDSIFHIYDLRDNKLKSAFGQIGEGPQEFVVPWLIQNQFADLLIEDRHIIHRFQINEKRGSNFQRYKRTQLYQSGQQCRVCQRYDIYCGCHVHGSRFVFVEFWK